ncbi:MAG TPA: efflux RND transporter periplasmic adaptor subunit [Thermoanaerobaculia bacterium]|nr:efflux RND transporter periplasmic adaptor subunit [Thermoanaerobaculia bacterium]
MPVDKVTLDGLRIERPDLPTRRRVPWLAIVAIVVVIAGAAIAWAVVRGRGKDVRVATAHAVSHEARGAVLNASGYVTARRQATVSSKVTGKVVAVHVEEGMRVKAGQELALLDNAYATKGLALAQAEAAAANSMLRETRVRIRQAELDFERANNLNRSQIASRADLDRARAELDAWRARLASQSDSYTVAQRSVNIRRQEVEDTIIRAPFDGVVVTKDAQPGEMISPVSAGGGFTRTGICTIVDMESLEIEVDVSEAYINRVKTNQPVEAVLDAYPDWKIGAHVITAVPTADRQKATVKVRIGIDQKDARILPDMGVKVSFIDDSPAAATSTQTIVEIPKAAVRRDGEQDIVLVVKDEKLERRAVKVSTTEGDVARIVSGINDGEDVVIEGPADLKDGEDVNVVKEKKS